MKITHRWWNSTIRIRLTILYAGTFFLAGVALIALMYIQLNQVTGQQLVIRSVSIRNGEPQLPNKTIEIQEPQTPNDVLPENVEPPIRPFVLRSLSDISLNDNGVFEQQFRIARTETLKRMLIASIVSLVAVGVVASILGWILAGQVLHPLRQITATARRVADRNLHERIALEGPDDEIKDLADTLDSMLERLDRSFDSQQRFTANASHELRTPLAINRTLIEVALLEEPEPDERLRQLGNTLLAVNQRHEKLIDGLLTLTSSEQRVAEPQPLELSEIVRHVLAESTEKAQSAGIDIETELELAPTSGDSVLLERLIHNLVDNASRYNLPQNGWIRVATYSDAHHASIIVENTGPVVPPYEIPRLFEPFQRISTTERLADHPKSGASRGAGLGLSIVRSVAAAHGGEVNAEARREGGLKVTVLIPNAPSNNNSKQQ